MKTALIPQPQRMRTGAGFFGVPQRGCIGISHGSLYEAAAQLETVLPRHEVFIRTNGARDSLVVSLNPGLPPGGYNLAVTKRGIRLDAESVSAAACGARTLLQLAAQSPRGMLPILRIRDWPDFQNRGIYYDVTRGRVPKLERLMELVELLAFHKINQFQFYIEHAFQFRGHPDLWKGASPLTAKDVLTLDRHCRKLHIELIPSLASLGHMQTVLKYPQYHQYCEDWGIGKYLNPDVEKVSAWMKPTPGSLCPANPGSYRFLDSLFAEFLPLFSSKRFNVCCDETYDLGLGQSYELCRRKGKGNVYLGHILKLRHLAAKYGKKIMFWGDIIRAHPELIKKIPKDVIVLDWRYEENHDFDTLRDFKKAGLTFYGCPGTSAWNTLLARTSRATLNIHGFAAAGRRHGAAGLLTTDWGDGGHCNFMENSWHGFIFAAEQAWNSKADMRSFTGRFCRLFLNVDSAELARAIDELGNITQFHFTREDNSTIWYNVFFSRAGDRVFENRTWECKQARNGKMTSKTMKLDATLARTTIRKLRRIRAVFARYSGRRSVDPRWVLPYWIFGVDALLHAARKLEALCLGGKGTIAQRRLLKAEMAGLLRRFRRLWLARNRTSEMRTTVKRYRTVLRSYDRASRG